MARTHRIDERLAALKAAQPTGGEPTVSGIFAPELWPFSLAVVAAGRRGGGRGCWRCWSARACLHWGDGDTADHSRRHPGGALGWLHFGKVPLLVILVIFLMTFALTGFVGPVRGARRDRFLHAAAWLAVALAFVVGGVRRPRPRRRAGQDHSARRNQRGVGCEPGRPGRQRRDRDRARRQAGAKPACAISTAHRITSWSSRRNAGSGARVGREHPARAAPERPAVPGDPQSEARAALARRHHRRLGWTCWAEAL